MTVTCYALVPRKGDGDSQATLRREKVELPALKDNQVLVKISHAAQNPVDIQTLDGKAWQEEGAVLGCDFVGTVEEVGSKVTNVKPGTVISAFIWGGEAKAIGAYSDYSIADASILFPLTSSLSAHLSKESAATIPLAATTAWLGLLSPDCLNIPRSSFNGGKPSVLIWGGTSSVGSYAVQLCRLLGFKVAATCSKANFELVKSFGAEHVFDYKAEDVVDQIKAAMPDIEYAFDTIGSASTSAAAAKACAEGTGTIVTTRPGAPDTEEAAKHAKVTSVLVFTAFLKEHHYGPHTWPPSQADHDLAAELYQKIPGWIERGEFKPNDVTLLHGLDAVKNGIKMYKDGKISASKVVYAL